MFICFSGIDFCNPEAVLCILIWGVGRRKERQSKYLSFITFIFQQNLRGWEGISKLMYLDSCASEKKTTNNFSITSELLTIRDQGVNKQCWEIDKCAMEMSYINP